MELERCRRRPHDLQLTEEIVAGVEGRWPVLLKHRFLCELCEIIATISVVTAILQSEKQSYTSFIILPFFP